MWEAHAASCGSFLRVLCDKCLQEMPLGCEQKVQMQTSLLAESKAILPSLGQWYVNVQSWMKFNLETPLIIAKSNAK